MLVSVLSGVGTFVQWLVISMFLDTIIFLTVDKICKVLLSNCRTLQEKRDIWLFEALALFGLSTVVFAYSHTPMLLWLLGTITFISATLTGRVDIQFYWESLRNYWSEFSDQEESIQNMYLDPTASQTPVYKNQVSDEQNREYMRQAGEINIANAGNNSNSSIGEGLQTLKYNEKTAAYEYVGPVKPASKTKGSGDNGSALRRRPMHSTAAAEENIVTSVQPDDDVTTPSMLDNLESIGSKVWSAIGFQKRDSTLVNLPPGLSGTGNNLCFLNCVLQCLARAPNLADELAEELKSCSCRDRHRLTLLDAVAETLQQIDVLPNENTTPVVDTTALCKAGSVVNPDILSHRSKYQLQQDACEFLSWLLYETHEVINDSKSDKERAVLDESMAKLKTVYGNISESYTKVMKTECKEKICHAVGIDDPDIVEPVQNLCNMDWISHRRQNRSVIDDLFTFQSLALQMCSTCNHVSTSVQTMNILPIPVKNQKPCIPLCELLAAFTTKESLSGRDGLQCDYCQAVSDRPPQTPFSSGVQTRSSAMRATQSHTPATPLSPIQAQPDSTVHYQAANFLASTPLHPGAPPGKTSKSTPALVSNPPARVITDGVRQSFLRRLPECFTIQLLRFNFDPFSKKIRKIHTPISIPLSDFDLKPTTYDAAVDRDDMTGSFKSYVYTLYGLSLHIGGDSTHSGHYIAYCKGKTGKWYKYDDDQVAAVEDIEAEMKKPEVEQNSYLLFYKQQHKSSDNGRT